MHVAAVIGPSGAGKTRLVERLVPALADPVATVKSIHHDIEPDDRGTDTHRHRTAGAASATGVTPSLSFEVRAGGKGERDDAAAASRTLEALLVERADEGVAVTLVEGFSRARLPTILVGDVEPSTVGGPIIGRGDGAVLDSLAAAIRETRAFTTPVSVVRRFDRSRGRVVGVVSGSIPADRPIGWNGESPIERSIRDALPTFDRSTETAVAVRPSVVPGADRAVVIVGVRAAEHPGVTAALTAARELLRDHGAAHIEERRRG